MGKKTNTDICEVKNLVNACRNLLFHHFNHTFNVGPEVRKLHPFLQIYRWLKIIIDQNIVFNKYYLVLHISQKPLELWLNAVTTRFSSEVSICTTIKKLIDRGVDLFFITFFYPISCNVRFISVLFYILQQIQEDTGNTGTTWAKVSLEKKTTKWYIILLQDISRR